MAPTPATQAIAAPIFCNVARRRTGFDAGAADERLSDSSSSVGISKITILNHGQPIPDAGKAELSVAKVAIERPSKLQCCVQRWRHGCRIADLYFSWISTRAIPLPCRQGLLSRDERELERLGSHIRQNRVTGVAIGAETTRARKRLRFCLAEVPFSVIHQSASLVISAAVP